MVAKAVYDNASNTPEKYRFRLLNTESNQEITLKDPPIGWESGVIQIDRDIEIGGVFTSFQVSSLTFIKEGAAFLNTIWNEKEFNGKCDLIIEWFKFSIRDYVEMPSRFSLNFATAKLKVKVGNQSIGFLIEAKKEDILVKLENRRDKDVDISKIYFYPNGKSYIKTIGEAELKPYSDLKQIIKFPETHDNFQTIWVSDYTNSGNINNNKDHEIFTEFNTVFSANEFNESQEIDYQTDLINVNSVANLFNNSEEDREVVFYWHIAIEVTNRKGGIFNPQNVYAIILEVVDGNAVIYTERVIDIGKKTGTFAASGSNNFSLKLGESIRIYVKTDDTRGINAYIRYSYFRITQNIATYSERDIESIPIYECFEIVLQHNLDVQFPFYSEFFGRQDTPYNLNGDVYSSENQLRFASIMSGLNIRGATLFDPNNPLPVSFDTLFKSLNAMYNLGYETEIRDGFERIRIENYDYFFEDIEVLDLSARISKYDIESEAMWELAYSEVKSGFKDYKYERINGRSEFNTESLRTSLINTASKYDIVSDIRADTMGISGKIIQGLTTVDTEEDNELFIIKTQREGGDWKPEKQENITVEEDSSLFDNTFNLYYSPTRMFKRHGNRLKGALIKFLSSYFRFQKSNKYQDLKTTGEEYTVTENDDILVNDLADPIFRPIKHIVTCFFTLDELQTFMANPKRYITLSNDIKIYILSLKKKNNENKATIEGIEKYN